MPRKKQDRETKQLLDQGQAIKDLVESNGWKEARKRLIHTVSVVRDISTLTEKDPEKLFQEVAARQIAAEILLNWLKAIEGDAEQFKANSELLRETYEENYVIRFDNQE